MNSNYCVCCGEEIPEGRMVCPYCENDENRPERRKKKTVTEAPLYEPPVTAASRNMGGKNEARCMDQLRP